VNLDYSRALVANSCILLTYSGVDGSYINVDVIDGVWPCAEPQI
jgi:hypothetical protein